MMESKRQPYGMPALYSMIRGIITGAVATFKDITEQKHSDTIIHHQNAALEGINRIFQEALTCDTEEEWDCLSGSS